LIASRDDDAGAVIKKKPDPIVAPRMDNRCRVCMRNIRHQRASSALQAMQDMGEAVEWMMAISGNSDQDSRKIARRPVADEGRPAECADQSPSTAGSCEAKMRVSRLPPRAQSGNR